MNGMNARVIVAELLGTFVLVGFGSLSIVTSAATNLPAPLIVPFGFSFALLAGIAIFGHVSGAHFNPAVTLAALFDGRISLTGAIAYWISQFAGALLASLGVLLLFGTSGKDFVKGTITSPPAAGTDGTPSIVTEPAAFAVEALLAAVFIAVILTVTARASKQAVFVIPLTLLMIHFVAIPITGASVNPARSFAPAIVSGTYDHLWIYLSAPFLGSLMGWGLYRLMGVFDDGDSLETAGASPADDDFLDEDDV